MKFVIIKNWRKYHLPHVMCGYADPTDLACFGSITVTFGDGSWVGVDSLDDLIVTDINPDDIPE
ncbi:hypothetical protein [Crenobacter cavernae]|uniref:Uncharacterized protein n=1 Tax=Crenobacter cavernae TaxID=2290923 RepID=A0A345Y6T9_9NEIS|nr:hypothetical protein [Crenobacter cavernae]AXK39641.1 hypothetical protein DWG20_09395 [Crenobacter cavernae]